MAEGELLSRVDLLSGRMHRDRRATRRVGLIESRVLYMRFESRRALEAYFLGSLDQYERRLDRDYLQTLRERANSDWQLQPADLERFVHNWQHLVPTDLEQRAAVLRALVQRARLTPGEAPLSLQALGASDEAVRSAFRAAYGSTLDELLASITPQSAVAEDGKGDSFVGEAEDEVDWVVMNGGSLLFREGDESDSLYVVISGRLRVVRPAPDGGEITVGEIVRGQVVGEAGALTGESRSATVYAARDSELLRLPQSVIMRVSQRYPEVMLRINREMGRRLRANLLQPQTRTRGAVTFALVPAHEGAPVRAVASQLASMLGHLGATQHITLERLDREFGWGAAGPPPEGEDSELITWLTEQESRHRYVLYEAAAAPAPWTWRALRQADRIVLVAAASADPRPGPLELEIRARGLPPPMDLMLVQPHEAHRPSRTREWLRLRPLNTYYHLRLDDPAQLAHVARRLAGKGLGLVLGGGGARGYAHIGVMKALLDRGVEVDAIGGTSMGALMGSLRALGLSTDEITERVLPIASRRALLDPTLPIASFFAGEKVARIYREGTERARIEDLWRPFFCVSTNLTHAGVVIHREGAIWWALRCTSAIPGIFPPMLNRDGEVIVDGGLVNNLPIDVMWDSADIQKVIAVNVSPEREESGPYSFGPSISGWEAALGRLRGAKGKVRVPTFVETMARASEVRGVALGRATRPADLLIEPPVARYSILDFARCSELIEIGYDAASRALEGWVAPTRQGADGR
jgi:predicted acylesterase/phospholipase RssA/CRP-like cAMP-binding protein